MNIKEILIHALGGVTNDELRTAKAKAVAETEAKLKGDIDKTIKTNGDLIKENLNLSKKCGELEAKLAALGEVKEEPKEPAKPTYYYMYNSFEDMFYIEEGVRYINGQCDKILKDNSFRSVYNEIWANDLGHKVTFKEFNDGFNKLYKNRQSELVDEYLKNQLIQVKYFTYSVEESDVHKFTYDKQGKLCYRASMTPVYK